MRYLFVRAMFALLLPLAAFGQAPPTIDAVGARDTLVHSVGVHPDPDRGGLRGGGPDYRVRFTQAGFGFEPALGPAAPTTPRLSLRYRDLRRGAEVVATAGEVEPRCDGPQVVYPRGRGVDERFDLQPDGVALSWRFEQPIAGGGDLVVRYDVATDLGAPQVRDGGLSFTNDFGGVRIGGVTGIDADGARVPGTLRWIDGGIELALPAAFVDQAAYPLVLDPLIGSLIGVASGLTFADGEPDAAYDGSTGVFLVVWNRTFAADDVDVRGRVVSLTGALGGLLSFGSSSIASPPRVANLGGTNRFGVVWRQVAPPTITPLCTIVFQHLTIATSALSPTATLAVTTTSTFGQPDIGCDPDALPGSGRGGVVVWEDEDLDSIRARRLSFDTSGALEIAAPVTLLQDGLLGPNYSEPSLSRATGSDGNLLLAVRRRTPLLGSSGIEARLVAVDLSVLGPLATVASSASDNLFTPDVDGFEGRWIVAHERRSSGAGTYDAAVVTPVAAGAGGTITSGTPVVFGGSVLTRADRPTVGFASGRAWIGYQQTSTLPTLTKSLRVVAVDSGSCTNCNDPFTPTSSGGGRIVVATVPGNGAPVGDLALAVWHDSFDDVTAQRLQNHGSSGTTLDLGGACGIAGTPAFNRPPGIGTSQFLCILQNVPATAQAVVFNFAQPMGTVPCGPCVWTPFSITAVLPNTGSSASVGFPIPCLPALVTAQFEVQWTTIDPTFSPCAVFPGLSLSSRTLVTIGN